MSKPFAWQEPFLQSKDNTEYTLLSGQHITVTELDGEEVIKVAPEALTLLAQHAFYEASFFLRAAHLKQIASILHDPQASDNDKYVALQLLRNAEVSAKGVLPNCQDTGTATIVASKGQSIWTGGDDAEALSKGIYTTFQENNLRYSQNAPLDMYTEVNTQTNLPAQIDISATPGNEYRFLFVNKGGGSANKAALFQETKSILQPEKLTAFLIEKMKSLGTAACPPYHIAFVVGGLSADQSLKVAKLASTKYYDNLPTEGNELGQAFRDTALETALLNASREFGIGAQFGGKYFAHDIRVIRLPRHGGSCPIAMALSCSADRNIKGKINKQGIWLEKLEHNPGKFIPDSQRTENSAQTVQLDLNRPLKEIMADLSKLPIGTRVSLSGSIVVARDIAHAEIKARLDKGEAMPDYMKNHIVYYAGPAKTPDNQPCGSLGPTTGGRMDGYVDQFQAAGGSLVMLSKGNRSQQVTDACLKHGGFNLGSIGGAAALLAQQYVKSLRCLEYPELGMEAVWMMEVKNLPAFVLVDDKGNNFFEQFEQKQSCASCPAKH
ncbi:MULTISPECIES: class I fumarate hydratase [Buttiauxella]|jgi:fumarate hydratase class I|uniref:Fumarate hydratase class I n=1 Tax=Buttiauxella ferragutiae ATCC 51602 TaxID=1354252 RepID=A0ABX2W9D2_9ENTR|nr:MULTISPECIES: class I fumarate hydratase [Buttiauxella]AYN29196.1 class I fumarate hydratase [Buttiauxella sp. 3AFRM03]MCE0828471.1 class I fumarate hydratase [Buttiauxella ferragutiae]OAT28348.1 fumarate hydratase class I, aerobic [Buttiauxella ferragutiae ATCC 51602]TDN49742.1 homodimeric fumarase (class I) [Buttiauxella sp. JUb87]UNK62310.1 class I fumarate hydratase [Buttiauxella ferragutiae]